MKKGTQSSLQRKKMAQCMKYPAETGAGHYYFSLLVLKATCLLDPGGLSLCCCHNILCLFSTRMRGSLDLHFPSKGLSAFPHFQSWPPNTTSGDDWWHHPNQCQIEARVAIWHKAEDLWCERLTVSSERFTVGVLKRFSLPLHYFMIVLFYVLFKPRWWLEVWPSACRLVDQSNYLVDWHLKFVRHWLHPCKRWFPFWRH